MSKNSNSANTTCLVLLFIFVLLILLLVYLYRRLNRDTDGQYTVRKIVLGEGGLRDQVRSGVGAVETRLRVHLWPRSRRSDEEDVVVDEEGAKERDVESGQSQIANHSKEAEEGDGENVDVDVDEDSDDDYSSMGGTDLRERAKLMEDVDQEDTHEEKSIEMERKEEEPGKGREEEVKEEGKKAEGLNLLVNLQELSGSAIWSEEKKDKNEESDLTAL